MNPTWCTIFLVYFVNFIYNLYMFRTSPGPSSGGTVVFMRHLVLVILYRWLSGMHSAYQTDSEPSCFPLWDYPSHFFSDRRYGVHSVSHAIGYSGVKRSDRQAKLSTSVQSKNASSITFTPWNNTNIIRLCFFIAILLLRRMTRWVQMIERKHLGVRGLF